MAYTIEHTDHFERGFAILEDIRDNVLEPLRDAGVFTHVALGLPHLDQELMSSVVDPGNYPAAFAGRQLGDVSYTTRSEVGNHVASTRHRIANFSIEVWMIDSLDPGVEIAEEKEKDLLVPLIDKMREDPKRSRQAINTIPTSHGGTLETLGSVIVVGCAFAVPYQFKYAKT